jgi:hypothetical protein
LSAGSFATKRRFAAHYLFPKYCCANSAFHPVGMHQRGGWLVVLSPEALLV